VKVGQGARALLRRIAPLRHLWNATYSAVYLIRDPWRTPAAYDRLFQERNDPFNYKKTSDQERHRIALGMIKQAFPNGFANALEIGCAEGTFTQPLALLGSSVEAIDYSSVAVDRARQLVTSQNVVFRVVDARSSLPNKQYDLVVLMDVLGSIARRKAIKRLVNMIAQRVGPGGYLLISDVRLDSALESSWWTRAFLRGGQAIVQFVLSSQGWRSISVVSTPTHTIALVQRT
jgi:2-polyprenyl-3-methyl-5-hydroxy-6-metoxy-1,4-benzoquinol methylase